MSNRLLAVLILHCQINEQLDNHSRRGGVVNFMLYESCTKDGDQAKTTSPC